MADGSLIGTCTHCGTDHVSLFDYGARQYSPPADPHRLCKLCEVTVSGSLYGETSRDVADIAAMLHVLYTAITGKDPL